MLLCLNSYVIFLDLCQVIRTYYIVSTTYVKTIYTVSPIWR